MRVAILGAGPSGSALATLLARAGAAVTLFDDGKRPALLVGESLVPAVIPILRRLGVEEEVANLGQLKPGASFLWAPGVRIDFEFARFAPDITPYAYNVPRPAFDEVLARRAASAGVTRVGMRAKLRPCAAGSAPTEVELAEETLAQAPALGGRQPDLIVDATGRARTIARLLDLPARVGPRKDIAYFAHFEDFHWEHSAGQIVTSRLEAGWSWFIPLKDRLSVGIVAGQDYWAAMGRSATERYERALASDPRLAHVVGKARRVSEVASYNNYQLVSERGTGPGWVAVGDAFGFVDPMLSPGVLLALRSAELVADALVPSVAHGAAPTPSAIDKALRPYAATQTELLDAWMELVAHLYDGRLLALVEAGRDWLQGGTGYGRTLLQNHIERHMALLACGVGTTSRYSRGLVRFLARYGLRGVEPADHAIR